MWPEQFTSAQAAQPRHFLFRLSMYDREAHLEIRPQSREHAKNPLERVYMDMMSSVTPLIEGYINALVIVDDALMYRWVYGLKEKSDANAAARKWICDIANIRARDVLQILIRDNAGELKSADLNTYIESLGVRTIFQWHMSNTRMDRLNHRSILSCFWVEHKWLSRDYLENYGIELWLMLRIQEMSHVTIASSLRLLIISFMENQRICPSSGHSDVEHTHTSMKSHWRPPRKRQAHSSGGRGGKSRFFPRKQWVCRICTNIAESHGNQSRQIWWELCSLTETISDWWPCQGEAWESVTSGFCR